MSLDETGAFSDTLLAALTQGPGSLVTFDPVRKKYLVRWDSLAQFLIDRFRKNPFRLGFENDKPVLQQPQRDILPNDLGGEFPFLVALDPGEVGMRTLTLDIQPSALRAKSKVTVVALSAAGARWSPRQPVPADKPFEKRLALGVYMAVVETDDPGQTQFQQINLADDQTCLVTLTPPGGPLAPTESDGGARPQPRPLAAARRRGRSPRRLRRRWTSRKRDLCPWLAGGTRRMLPAAILPQTAAASLSLKASDPFTQVELLDVSGPRSALARRASLHGARQAGHELAEARDLPGPVLPAEPPMTERIVPVTAGTQKEVEFSPQAPQAAAPIAADVTRAIPGPDDSRPRGLDDVLDQARNQAAWPDRLHRPGDAGDGPEPGPGHSSLQEPWSPSVCRARRAPRGPRGGPQFELEAERGSEIRQGFARPARRQSLEAAPGRELSGRGRHGLQHPGRARPVPPPRRAAGRVGGVRCRRPQEPAVAAHP